jgi:uncharacterized alpha-E superfamily protein
MLSRVAERIYWMARYIERAEDTARIVNVNSHLLLDLPKDTAFGWEPLLFIIGNESLFYQHYPAADEPSVIKFMLGDLENPSSILSSLHRAREDLRTTRDLVPREAWEKLNDLYIYAKDHIEQAIAQRLRYEFLQRIIDASQLITGLLSGIMSHNYAYEFVRIGRNLERADMTTRIVDVRSANLLLRHTGELTPFENIQWMSVLKSLSAYQMYRRHVHVRVNGTDVLRFLLQDRDFPRSLYFCLGEVQRSLGRLPRHEALLQDIIRLKREVHRADVRDLTKQGLHTFIDELQLALAKLHDQIRMTYFPVPAQVQRSSSIAA